MSPKLFKPGEEHPRWRGGRYFPKGYVRITAGPHRGKYEHRVIASQAWEETHGHPLPRSHEVHHLDFVRAHNCRQNLLILGPGLHRALHQDGWSRSERGTYCRREELEEVPF